jgi:hypothetical protein
VVWDIAAIPALHLFAKNTLEKHMRIRLPEIEVYNSIYFNKVEDFGKGILDLDIDEYDLDCFDEETFTRVKLLRLPYTLKSYLFEF